MREAASKRIPEEWYKRRKKGFPVPIYEWFKTDKYYNIVKEIFNEDWTSEFFDNKKIKAKFKYADKLKIPYVIVIGEDEIVSGKLTFKNMGTGDQEQKTIEEIIEFINNN